MRGVNVARGSSAVWGDGWIDSVDPYAAPAIGGTAPGHAVRASRLAVGINPRPRVAHARDVRGCDVSRARLGTRDGNRRVVHGYIVREFIPARQNSTHTRTHKRTRTRRVSAIQWIPVTRPPTIILALNTKQQFYYILNNYHSNSIK
jgi:hypothetical protein